MKNARRANPLVLAFHTAGRAYWNDIVQGVSAFARESGWNLQVVENEVESHASVGELLRFWKPEGCIFEDSIGKCTKADIRALGDRPVVFVNCELMKSSVEAVSITVDSRKIGELAARELMTAGLAHFAFYGFSEFRWSGERCDGFAAALDLNGRTCDRFTRAFKVSDRTYRKRLVKWLAALPRPGGVFAANDLLAEEVLNVCREIGVHVPEDICVIGVDNDVRSCENSRPTLSSINPDFSGEGFSAATALARMMDGCCPADGEREYNSPAVIRRQSTRRLSTHATDISAAVEFIRLNACKGISAKDVFPLFSCSRRRVEQRFRAELGHSVLDEINAVRLARAEELLAQPYRAIESIAQECGFQSTAHLRVLFRRQTGMSLREWRKAHFNK